MLVKLEEIIKSKKSLDILVEKKGIDFKNSYALAKIHRKIQKEFELFEKVRNAKIMEVGNIAEDGNYQISKEDFPKFQQDIQELLDVEIDISGEPINIDIFEKCDIEPILFSDLYWLIA